MQKHIAVRPRANSERPPDLQLGESTPPCVRQTARAIVRMRALSSEAKRAVARLTPCARARARMGVLTSDAAHRADGASNRRSVGAVSLAGVRPARIQGPDEERSAERASPPFPQNHTRGSRTDGGAGGGSRTVCTTGAEPRRPRRWASAPGMLALRTARRRGGACDARSRAAATLCPRSRAMLAVNRGRFSHLDGCVAAGLRRSSRR
ncbi:hypothetical protein SCP_0100210 [Sparassis crispa]|uniref:Uncharacterized protein n=1 Tax=Sparassis crispa TaxID=139825 RepID=A0A401G4R4_9APHY|nr:hypothetical protein SCP_0100210 [Sparassis crispa]GBE77149.1 hypothetical protein SCP_0100210 [Sparassis crispa]